ncbi:hypothetical protein STEG23_031236, partial [Scotinomys teguina]
AFGYYWGKKFTNEETNNMSFDRLQTEKKIIKNKASKLLDRKSTLLLHTESYIDSSNYNFRKERFYHRRYTVLLTPSELPNLILDNFLMALLYFDHIGSCLGVQLYRASLYLEHKTSPTPPFRFHIGQGIDVKAIPGTPFLQLLFSMVLISRDRSEDELLWKTTVTNI